MHAICVIAVVAVVAVAVTIAVVFLYTCFNTVPAASRIYLLAGMNEDHFQIKFSIHE